MPDTIEEAALEHTRLAHARARGAHWFAWLATLSVINTVMTISGSDRTFIFGLGITQMIDGALSEFAMSTRIVGYGIDLVIAGMFFGIWRLALKRTWPFFAGAALYLVDALIFVAVEEWLGVAVHAFVLFAIVRGLIAAMKASEAAPSVAQQLS